MIRVELPVHLRTLACVDREVRLVVAPDTGSPPTLQMLLDTLERCYPVLRGTIRDHVTGRRRPFVRFFACERDFSHDPLDTPLPELIVSGAEPFLVVGAMAGG